MNDMRVIADRFEIESLRGEFTDAGTMGDYDRFAALFTEDGRWRIPGIGVDLVGRGEIRAGVERLQGLWDFFVQHTHPGTIRLDGDRDGAEGRAYVSEFGRLRDGRTHQNHAIYHDHYRRTPDGWKFSERRYEVRCTDTTALTGTAPRAAADDGPGAGEGGPL
ncbi:nuclear transport factor 2 family protein [Streptomyces sp. NBC_01497]|uniref:nuclear transport factor 2 family protein n=1 Tax=Streptomyces sp. NBC_01497 TaxID=2903885 RepID=UPI002E32C745|nr:nuclear transport factor 2 family protein [Streptomyces sp. NBC_01497]